MTTKTILAVLLAIGLAVSLTMTPAVYAYTFVKDAKGDATDPNFDIRQAGLDDSGNPYLKVTGKAGGTTPSSPSQSSLVYAYVFVTNAGIYAVTSHQAEDSGQVGNDLEWHSHLVTLDGSGCVTGISDAGVTKLSGEKVTVLGTGATDVLGVATAE